MKKSKKLEIKQKNKKNSLPYSEICDNTEEAESIDNSLFEDGSEIIMGGDIDIKNGTVEKMFSFSETKEPIINVNVKDEDVDKLNIDSKKTINDPLRINRTYRLRPSTIKMLDELKCFIYDDPCIKYQDIVDASIRFFYDYKKNQ